MSPSSLSPHPTTLTLPDYPAAIAYLEDLIARPILPREQVGLARIETLLAATGHPERRFITVQVAGTAGKGSTTAIIEAILRQAALHTGSFTSPHLQSYRERIALNGTPIDEATWTRLLRDLLPLLARMEANDLPNYAFGRAAFLEVLWTMACQAFASHGVACAVVEAGMGGRRDPTTANTARVAVITNVSLDHTEQLGPTVEAIATEKAGLIKPGQILITAAEGSALAVIRATCEAQHATLWAVGRDGAIAIEPEGDSPDAPFTVETPVRAHRQLRLRLRGLHQRANAACAIGAVDALAQRCGLHIPSEAVTAGLACAGIPGRLESFEGSPTILLDGAKSVAGAAALAEALDTLYRGRRVVLILGIYGDKDLEAITGLLCPRADAVVVTEPPWTWRAGAGARIASLARAYCSLVEQAPCAAQALTRAREVAAPDDLIVVAGSLHLVGAVLDVLRPPADRNVPL